MTKRAYHHGNLPQAIVDHARHVVELEGVANFSLATVARALGVSTGAPYYHFKDAEDVLRQVAEQAYGELMDRVRGAADSVLETESIRASTLRAAASACCHEFLQYSLDHPALFRMAVTQYRPAGDSEAVAFGNLFTDTSSRLLVSSGLIGADRADGFDMAVYVMLRGIAAVSDEVPRLVAYPTQPHALLDELLDALFLAFGP